MQMGCQIIVSMCGLNNADCGWDLLLFEWESDWERNTETLLKPWFQSGLTVFGRLLWAVHFIIGQLTLSEDLLNSGKERLIELLAPASPVAGGLNSFSGLQGHSFLMQMWRNTSLTFRFHWLYSIYFYVGGVIRSDNPYIGSVCSAWY